MSIEQPAIQHDLTPTQAWEAAGPQFEELKTTRDLGDDKYEMATDQIFLS